MICDAIHVVSGQVPFFKQEAYSNLVLQQFRLTPTLKVKIDL